MEQIMVTESKVDVAIEVAEYLDRIGVHDQEAWRALEVWNEDEATAEQLRESALVLLKFIQPNREWEGLVN